MNASMRLTAVAVALFWGSAALAATPAQKCEATKKVEAGKFAACRLKAESKLVTSGDVGTYNTAIGKCATKLSDKFDKLEAGGACPSTGDADAIVSFLSACSDGVAGSTDGGGTLPTCGDELINVPGEECDGGANQARTCTALGFSGGTLACTSGCLFDTTGCTAGGAADCGNGTINGSEDCDQGNLNGVTCQAEGFAGGTLACSGGCNYDYSGCWNARYVDNGDGTITDNQERLMWEKKVKFGGGQDAANPHDADNRHPWSGTCAVGGARCQPTAAAATACLDGAERNTDGCALCGSGACNVTLNSVPNQTAWQFVVALNAATFAGHDDWRMPTFTELFSLIDTNFAHPSTNAAFDGASCGPACSDLTSPACSCTNIDGYTNISATAHPTSAPEVYVIDLEAAQTFEIPKTSAEIVRAVRSLD